MHLVGAHESKAKCAFWFKLQTVIHNKQHLYLKLRDAAQAITKLNICFHYMELKPTIKDIST